MALNLCADHTVTQNLRQPLQTLSTSSTTNELILFSKISTLEVFISFPVSTHKDCFSNAKQGGAELSSLPALYWQKPSNLLCDYALSTSLYHCSAVSLFVSLQCCRRKPHKFHYTLECAGVRQNILYVCYLYFYHSIFVFCIFLYLYSIIIAGHRVWWSARLVVLSIMCTSNYIPICQPQ